MYSYNYKMNFNTCIFFLLMVFIFWGVCDECFTVLAKKLSFLTKMVTLLGFISFEIFAKNMLHKIIEIRKKRHICIEVKMNIRNKQEWITGLTEDKSASRTTVNNIYGI